MTGRLKKNLLLLLVLVLLVGSGQVQKLLNLDRDRLGLTRVATLENAPPVLAFTTVALGGFRGLISNLLWARATELQDEDKFFEMVQLADWITKLEPHFTQVWLQQAWNMAFNISVKFKDFSDRWRWVENGIVLLRDQGLRYNPNDILIYRELAWIFQFKMGQNLDDAHLYYKKAWFDEMTRVFKVARPDFDELIEPKTDEARQRREILINEFKLDPKLLKELDSRYGPLEWRLPEAHAIYWAALALRAAEENPERIDKESVITVRRVIYQSMQQAVLHGRVIAAQAGRPLDEAPNLDLIRKANDAYEQAMVEDEKSRSNISRAHRNLLRDAVTLLYSYNRMAEASLWYSYMVKKFPSDTLIDGQPNSFPANMSLDEFAIARIEEQVGDVSRDKSKAVLEGLLSTSFYNLAIGDDERAAGFASFAEKVWRRYQIKTAAAGERVKLPPLNDIRQIVLERLLDPERGFDPEMAGQLRTKLNLPAAANSVPVPPNP